MAAKSRLAKQTKSWSRLEDEKNWRKTEIRSCLAQSRKETNLLSRRASERCPAIEAICFLCVGVYVCERERQRVCVCVREIASALRLTSPHRWLSLSFSHQEFFCGATKPKLDHREVWVTRHQRNFGNGIEGIHFSPLGMGTGVRGRKPLLGYLKT